MLYFYLTITCIISTVEVKCDAFLEKKLMDELKITKLIDSRIEHVATTSRIVERELGKLLALKWSPLEREDYVSTPLTAMALVRRLVQDWPALVTAAGSGSELRHFPLTGVRWPDVSQLEGASKAAMRSQMTYDMSTDLLIRGLQNDVFVTNITAADCFEIARQYFLKERFSEAKEWLQHAITGVGETGVAPTRETLLHYMAATLCFLGDVSGSIKIIKNILKEFILSKPPKELIVYYTIMGTRGCIYPDERIFRLLNNAYSKSRNSIIDSVYVYRDSAFVEEIGTLCRSEVKVNSRLVCRYVHYQQPHLRFQPFKLEELQLDPPVVRFHDFMSDKESESIMREANKKMAPATVGAGKYSRQSDYRSSFVAWLFRDDKDKGTNWLDQRIYEATQLDTQYAEPHQISKYSVSGEYMPHRDVFRDGYQEYSWLDDRLATFMIYLSDAKQGGNTIFTQWKISVPPIRNSAVFWFNYKRNGEIDEDSTHGGCPVLKGSKWVLNKWIHNKANKAFPCTLEDASFRGFYL